MPPVIRDILVLLKAADTVLPQPPNWRLLQAGKPPDFFYCKSLLEAKGIVTVPGTGFKQAEGTLHFRTTILPPESDIEATAQDLTDFHKDFMAKASVVSWPAELQALFVICWLSQGCCYAEQSVHSLPGDPCRHNEARRRAMTSQDVVRAQYGDK